MIHTHMLSSLLGEERKAQKGGVQVTKGVRAYRRYRTKEATEWEHNT